MSRDADRYFDKWYGGDDSFEEEAATVVMSGGRAAAALAAMEAMGPLDDLADEPTTLMKPEEDRVFSSMDPEEFVLGDGIWEDTSAAQRTILRTPPGQARTVIRTADLESTIEERPRSVLPSPWRALRVGLALGLLTGILLSGFLIVGVAFAAL